MNIRSLMAVPLLFAVVSVAQVSLSEPEFADVFFA
jgi:hypothetical protein